MHSHFADDQSIELEQSHLHTPSSFTETDTLVGHTHYSGFEQTRFHGNFQDSMEMYAQAKQVTEYLDAHQDWFSRCAHPMTVEPIGQNGYALLIGRFGAFGYEVEPKVGLELLPQENGIYRIRTIPVPNYVAPGYDVDFQASQTFVEVPASEYFKEQKRDGHELPSAITRVEWHLDLCVALRFPKFIHKLPQSLIQSTGDRLLHQVVRQVSRRLTYKVQEDFHNSLGIPMPKQAKKR
jgi:hypothetical protein